MATEKKMKVWMTKYALTSGIKVVWVEPPSPGSQYVYTIPKGQFEYKIQLRLGKTAFIDWPAAFDNAEQQRKRQIKALEKKLGALKKMEFSGTP
jgi:hypothetical protein